MTRVLYLRYDDMENVSHPKAELVHVRNTGFRKWDYTIQKQYLVDEYICDTPDEYRLADLDGPGIEKGRLAILLDKDYLDEASGTNSLAKRALAEYLGADNFPSVAYAAVIYM